MKRLSFLFLFATCLVPAALAQTGKIQGVITDASTGETLPGVNVRIEGTTQGTATSIDGEYVIIGVRPGTYTIVASYVGFSTVRQEGVRVSVDLTTEVDFALREEVFEGEEVIVTADAVRVQRDLTSSETRITSERIENLPVQEVGDLLTAQAGITTSGSGIHIRGGRSSEIAYFIDGVRVSDGYDGSISVQVENDAIEELQVISGTFNAEYGNAMSGIINVVTKEGGSEFEGSFEAYSGSYIPVRDEGGEDFLYGRNAEQYTEDGIAYRDVHPFGYLSFSPTQYYNLQGSLGGPIFTDRLTFYGFGRYFKNEGWFYGANLYTPDAGSGDSSLVAMNPFEKLSGQVNVRLRLNRNMSLNLIALGSLSEGQNYDHAWRWAPQGRPTNYERGYNLNLKFTHTLSATTFYTLNAANYFSGFERYLYENPLDSLYNGILITTPAIIDVQTGERFLRGGTDLGRADRTSDAYLVKGDVTSQIHRNHLVKAGFEARVDYLRNESYALQGDVDEQTGQFIGTPRIPERTTNSFNQFDNKPVTASLYVQDKAEYENFIVNVGLRFDYFDPRASIPADPEDPNIFSPFKELNRWRDLDGNGQISAEERVDDNLKTIEEREPYWWEDASSKYQVSPRLGVAYPITAEGVIHFSYGHFLQIPTFNRLFENSQYKVALGDGLYGPYGNPDLKAEKTVMYELGLQQAVGPFVFDVTGFYRDVRNWVSTSVPIETRQPGVAYVVYANRDYSNVRGITLKASKGFSDHYSFDLNYTFQVAEGSNSDPAAEFFARQSGQPIAIALLPLDWDQRHTASASLYVGAGGWGASTLARYGSGYPYTPFFGQAEGRGSDIPPDFPQNARLKPASFNVDLYAFRDFDIGGVRPRLYVQVYNLLDARNPGSVFADTGQPDVTQNQLRGQFDPGYHVRPEFYAEPRRVQLGLSVRF